MTWLPLIALGGLLGFAGYGWAAFLEAVNPPVCSCSKGKVCAACLAESEAIRPKPEPTKEAA
jgi:hypothetical protein